MAEVIIDIGGQEIASTITRASAVIDIIKASEVLIAK
jgi:molybdopterin-binding protein